MFVILIPFEQFWWTCGANMFFPLYGVKVKHAEVTNMDFFYNGQKRGGSLLLHFPKEIGVNC